MEAKSDKENLCRSQRRTLSAKRTLIVMFCDYASGGKTTDKYYVVMCFMQSNVNICSSCLYNLLQYSVKPYALLLPSSHFVKVRTIFPYIYLCRTEYLVLFSFINLSCSKENATPHLPLYIVLISEDFIRKLTSI